MKKLPEELLGREEKMKHCEEERVGVETWRQWIGGPN